MFELSRAGSGWVWVRKFSKSHESGRVTLTRPDPTREQPFVNCPSAQVPSDSHALFIVQLAYRCADFLACLPPPPIFNISRFGYLRLLPLSFHLFFVCPFSCVFALPYANLWLIFSLSCLLFCFVLRFSKVSSSLSLVCRFLLACPRTQYAAPFHKLLLGDRLKNSIERQGVSDTGCVRH